jgi:hypothetical protein
MAVRDYAYLIMDVDGYCPKGCDQRRIVTPSKDGYRPRELGWTVFTPGRYAAGAFYFSDEGITGLPLLTVQDSGVRHVLTKVHGLPLNSYQRPIAADCLIRSDQLLAVIVGLCEFAGSDGEEVIVVHKGGNEGYWTALARPGTKTIDLADYGCPKIERIVEDHPEWMEGMPPPCIHHGDIVRGGQKGGVIHCPTLEVAILVRWIAEGDILDELLDE